MTIASVVRGSGIAVCLIEARLLPIGHGSNGLPMVSTCPQTHARARSPDLALTTPYGLY